MATKRRRRLGLALLLVLVGLAGPVLAHERAAEPSWAADRGLADLLDQVAESLLEELPPQELERAQEPRFSLFDPVYSGGSECPRFEKPHVGGTYPSGPRLSRFSLRVKLSCFESYGFARGGNAPIGLLVTSDPLGYVDGPSMYQFAGYSPFNFGDPLGLAIYAFDGTGNKPRRPTSVRKLFLAYDDEAYSDDPSPLVKSSYQRGVGSRWWTLPVGGLTGLGARRRVENAYRDLERNFAAGDGTIDIVGFSRGAAEAREFANVIYERGVTVNGQTKPGSQIKIRFMGLFDTVASMGWPGNGIDLTYRMSIPPTVQNVRHAVAADERRHFFPLRGTGYGCDNGSNFQECSFRGAHSDIGGGYKSAPWASRMALNWIWEEAKDAGVPFLDLEAWDEEQEGDDLILHDSKRGHERVTKYELEERTSARGPRQVF